MRYILLILFAITTTLHASDVTVFSNTGYKFWVIVNGEKMNTQASEKVVFSKPAGIYLMRIIIDSNLKNNMSSNSNIEVKEASGNLFKVDCANIFTDNIATELAITIRPYTLVNANDLSGKWTLKINTIKIENISIYMLETGVSSEFEQVVISDDSGIAFLNGEIDRVTNTIYINGITGAFYNYVKYNYLGDARGATCDWFYHNGFTTVLHQSQNSSYASSPKLLYYFITNKDIVCGEENLPLYDKKNIQLNLILER